MTTHETSLQLTVPEAGADQNATVAPEAATTESAALGLALSGGGVRAALFSLGVVIGLIATGCHRRVRCIASVSGGSILNAALAHGNRLTGLSDVTEFEVLASRLAASLAEQGVFAFSLRNIAATAWYVVQLIIRAIFTVGVGLVFLIQPLAQLHKFLAETFSFRSMPEWLGPGVLAASALAVLFVWFLLTRGLFQETRFRSVLHYVAGRFGVLNVEDWGTAGKGPSVMHVLVTTDLLSAEPMYFSNKFVYCRPYGWSTPKNIRTAEALYSSAAFPGVFPPKWLRTTRLRFQNGDMPGPLPLFLRLADGGVYNNLGNDWFEVLQKQSQTSPPLLWRFGELEVEAPIIEAKNVIIVNAGAPSRRIRFLFPFGTLARIMSVLYDNTVRPRVKLIREECGPLIDIAETPLKLATSLAKLEGDVGRRAKKLMMEFESRTDEFWADFTHDTAGTPTKLTKAGRRTAARLMLDGYLSSIVLLYSRFDGQLPKKLEGEAYFLRLVDQELPLAEPRRATTPTPEGRSTISGKPAVERGADDLEAAGHPEQT